LVKINEYGILGKCKSEISRNYTDKLSKRSLND
jgi:hypothetical protein